MFKQFSTMKTIAILSQEQRLSVACEGREAAKRFPLAIPTRICSYKADTREYCVWLTAFSMERTGR